MSKGTYSFTTPIYYVNAAPHLGTAYTTIAADTVERYQRMNGYDVAFVTGMDEHGQKVADTAAAKGMTPQAWCDSMEPAFREAWDLLGITYTDFVRTTEPRHAKSVQKFWQDLYDKGWCYKGSYEGWYCVHEETYYAESDLEKNEDGVFVCPDCKRPAQKAGGEENWFFKLSEFQEPLLKFYEENPEFIRPETRKNEIVSFVKSGLHDLSISRSTFDWGVPLPFDEGHVAYVWADALLAYLTGIGYADEEERAGEFDRRWPMQYHFVGKDITRFHCVIWPAMLMAAGLPITHTVFMRLLAHEGREDVQVEGQRAHAGRPVPRVRRGRVPLLLHERRAVRRRRLHLARAHGAGVQRRSGEHLGQPLQPRVQHDEEVLRRAGAGGAGVRRGARGGQPAARDIGRALRRVRPRPRRRGLHGCGRRGAEARGPREPVRGKSAPWNLAKSEETADQLAAVINALEAIRIIAVPGAVYAERVGRGLPPPEPGRRHRRDRHRGGDRRLGPATRRQRGGDWRPLFPRLDMDAVDLDME